MGCQKPKKLVHIHVHVQIYVAATRHDAVCDAWHFVINKLSCVPLVPACRLLYVLQTVLRASHICKATSHTRLQSGVSVLQAPGPDGLLAYLVGVPPAAAELDEAVPGAAAASQEAALKQQVGHCLPAG